jgi:anaerobic ribonucleoside-triphosphate reductase activating protein
MNSIRLHATELASRANGPGLRAVLWFQGCTLGCPGCFNPLTHDPQAGTVTDTATLAARLLARPNGIEGMSISGGEPFQQPEALLDLLTRLDGSGLSRLIFSGYTLREIEAQPLGPAILAHLDVLIAGRYVQTRHDGHALLGSSNQRIHLLTPRHSSADFTRVPGTEVIIHTDGSITLTGISPMAAPRPGAGRGLER